MRLTSLSRAEAARIAIRAQGLDRRRLKSMPDLLTHLGAVQLDTISVLARSHELVAYARLGAVGRDRVEATYWGHGRAFEYWSHAACILPMASYPLFAFRRRGIRARPDRWGAREAAVDTVRRALADRGPLTATELGGARRQSGWWNWSEAKDAVEWMLAIGEVAVTDRRSWKRVYDLASRAVLSDPQPSWVDEHGVFGPSDEECVRGLLLQSIRVLGVGTRADLRDVHRLSGQGGPPQEAKVRLLERGLRALLETGEIVEVTVEGSPEPWLADPAALRRIPRTDASVTTLLSPFDSLVWHRPRLQRLFDVSHRIEAYTPKHKRERGYFAMPLLHQGRIIGFVDPAREGTALVARKVTMFEPDVDAFAIALAEAAQWVGQATVRVDEAPSAAVAKAIARAANAKLSARA
jgi:uncharacterized protein YcaQ